MSSSQTLRAPITCSWALVPPQRAQAAPHRLAPRRRLCPPPAAFSSKNTDLLGALFEQARTEALPWVQDIVFPALGIRDDVEKEAERAPTAPPTALADPDSRFLEVLGVNLHYKERPATAQRNGAHNAPTVLLIHGFNASTFSWRANMDAVTAATGLRTLAYDRPPFGLSERPLEWGGPGQALQFNPYELDGSTQLAEGLLDQLGVDGPVVVVGHSAGAQVALELQRRRPGQVAALALVAPAVPTTPEHSFQRRATFGAQLRVVATRALLLSNDAGLRFVRRQIMQQRQRVAGGDLGFAPHPSTASSASSLDLESTASWEDAADAALLEAVEGYLKPLRAKDWDRAALLNLRAFTLPMAFDYGSLDAPVLVVSGRDDGGLAGNARALAGILEERRGGAESTTFVELPCGHVPMDEMPQEFNAALIDFLRETVC